MILGIDEVGRGPWAGPLVVGAVVLLDGFILDGLTDSKKLSAKKRLALDAEIRANAVGWGLGWVHADELDEIGLSAALKLATVRAVKMVDETGASYGEIILDGTVNFLKDTAKGQYVTTIAKADLLVPAVSAASIIAKVARDGYMAQQSSVYPLYGFDLHVGYGTAKHRDALKQYGVTKLHRRSFAPIKRLLGESDPGSGSGTSLGTGSIVNSSSTQLSESSKSKGDQAEDLAAAWLQDNNFIVRNRNWKTKQCEIDIVAEKDDALYFVEVKYRSSNLGGTGFDAITPKKLKQIKFASQLYCAKEKYSGNIKLAAIDVSRAKQVNFVEIQD